MCCELNLALDATDCHAGLILLPPSGGGGPRRSVIESVARLDGTVHRTSEARATFPSIAATAHERDHASHAPPPRSRGGRIDHGRRRARILRVPTRPASASSRFSSARRPVSGKTYAMLEAARLRRREGIDVVAAVVETHGRAETQAMLEGMEIIPRRIVDYRERSFEELDLDAVLARRPQLALVDELAHSNAEGRPPSQGAPVMSRSCSPPVSTSTPR